MWGVGVVVDRGPVTAGLAIPTREQPLFAREQSAFVYVFNTEAWVLLLAQRRGPTLLLPRHCCHPAASAQSLLLL